METMVQFIGPGGVFVLRGLRHEVVEVERLGATRTVRIAGVRTDGEPFDAELPWGETLDMLVASAPAHANAVGIPVHGDQANLSEDVGKSTGKGDGL